MSDYSSLISALVKTGIERNTYPDMASWFKAFKERTKTLPGSVERAIWGGRTSSCLGFAFSAAYQSAIESLFNLNESALASFCVTEQQGNHPRAIQTTLAEEGQTNKTFSLSGHKSFVSGGLDSTILYVACKAGEQPAKEGQAPLPLIKMVRVDTGQDGVSIAAMPELPFLPEVSHGSVSFRNVEIGSENILEGDGYLGYVKPFRTSEDLHVLAAITAFRLGEALAFDWPKESIEQHLSLLLSITGVADMPLDSPAMHLALSGCRNNLDVLIEKTDTFFQETHPAGFQHWLRDRSILGVAKKAHNARTTKAWDVINQL